MGIDIRLSLILDSFERVEEGGGFPSWDFSSQTFSRYGGELRIGQPPPLVHNRDPPRRSGSDSQSPRIDFYLLPLTTLLKC